MTDALPAALARVLDGVLAGPVAVGSVRRLSGGASGELSAVDVVDAAGVSHELVLRRSTLGSAGGMTAGVTAEAAALRVADAAGVPVPSVVATISGDEVLGDGYLMTRLVGEALPGRLLRDEEYAAVRPALLAQAATALAGIHAADASSVPVGRLGAAEQLDGLEGLHRSFGQAVPTFELVFRWLRERLPAPEPGDVLVHGDFRMGNLLCDARGLVAVLDWELVHLGDPHEDLGWFCAPAWRFGGSGPAGGLGSREELSAAYSAASGATVDPARVHYWEVLGTLKWGVICQLQASRVLVHGQRSVEHALIGRRVTEVELDLLLLLVNQPLEAGGVDGPAERVGDASGGGQVGTHPTAEQLLAAAADQLEEDVAPGLEARARFLTRVAARALRVVERERALGPRVGERLRRSAEASGLPEAAADLATSIREGAIELNSPELLRHLVVSALARLAIDNPEYQSLQDARERWPELAEAAVDSG